MKSIFKAVAIVTIFSVITRALGFLFRIFLSRKLGAVGLGIFQLSSSILGLFLTLVSSGLPLTTAKLVSKYNTENDLVKKSKVVTTALIIAIFVAIYLVGIVSTIYQIYKITIIDAKARDIKHPKLMGLLATSGKSSEGLILYLLHGKVNEN